MALELRAYAAILAELAATGESRSAVLASHGLDEASWEAIDEQWQERLSAELDDDGDGVPGLLAELSSAYAAAQRASAEPITLEQLAEVTRRLAASGDLRASLAHVGVTLVGYTRGSEHWTKLMSADSSLARQFEALVRAGAVCDQKASPKLPRPG